MADEETYDETTAWYLEVVSGALLFLLVFGMSGTVDPTSLTSSLKNYKAILTGLSLQFIMLPFIGFLVVRTFELTTNIGVMVLVVASSPGGSYSNWWCSIFNAELSLSVTMTAISTVASCVFLPLNLLLYAKLTFDADVVSNLNWLSMFTSLAIVISAIFLGLWGSWRTKKKNANHKFNTACNKVGNIAGISLVLFSIILSSIDPKGAIWNRDSIFYTSVAAPCLAGLVLSSSIATCLKLKKPERVTLSIECCYQNVGIAQGVAVGMFSGTDLAEAIGVPLYYGFMSSALLSLYCVICWKAGWTKAPKDESFCVIVSTNYELEEAICRDEGIEVIYNEEHMLQLQVSYDHYDDLALSAESSKPKPTTSFLGRSPREMFRRLSNTLSGGRLNSGSNTNSQRGFNVDSGHLGSRTFEEDESTTTPPPTEKTESEISFDAASSSNDSPECESPESSPLLLRKLKPIPITTSAIFARKKILGIDVDPDNKSKTSRLKTTLNIKTTLYEKSHAYSLTPDQREIIELLEGMITKIEIADAMMSLKDTKNMDWAKNDDTPLIKPADTI
ncbi:hypothetical protein TrLO_g3121 [Triparma laevis f. longispina]|uniref:SBF-domain-containing protein n=1 Tax=Triparma laevis f. longispina TaxID=1714387 RepID=A0A9W7C204_9STRA|nr:hypothetical protein TrLO_g3121 [Triparma laevis f. longispina]